MELNYNYLSNHGLLVVVTISTNRLEGIVMENVVEPDVVDREE